MNDKHKKVDRIIRYAFIAVLLIGFIINVMRDPLERIWFLEPWYLIYISILVTEAVRAIMEWKYVKQRNAYIFTVSQLIFIAVLLISIFKTNFLNWFAAVY